MAHKEDMFDRMWYQWFDCVYSCIPKELEDTVWTGLFRKHFGDIIRVWADSPPPANANKHLRKGSCPTVIDGA
jgi:hypothetical protein